MKELQYNVDMFIKLDLLSDQIKHRLYGCRPSPTDMKAMICRESLLCKPNEIHNNKTLVA